MLPLLSRLVFIFKFCMPERSLGFAPAEISEFVPDLPDRPLLSPVLIFLWLFCIWSSFCARISSRVDCGLEPFDLFE